MSRREPRGICKEVWAEPRESDSEETELEASAEDRQRSAHRCTLHVWSREPWIPLPLLPFSRALATSWAHASKAASQALGQQDKKERSKWS